MKILLVAHPYLNLYKCIVEELRLQKHQVTVIEETIIPGDPYYKLQNKYIRNFLVWKWEKYKIAQKYWEKKITAPIYNESYDLLFVIQGCTFDPYLLLHLKKINPLIKSSLYIWDSNEMYDFFRNAPYFDKVFSFDKRDVIKSQKNNINFLPFFWDKELIKLDHTNIEYKISSIGTEHHGRYYIYKKVINALNKNGIKHYIKLILPPRKNTILDRIRHIKNIIIGNKKDIELYKVRNGEIKCSFISQDTISPNELCKIIAQSESILDTDNDMQYGTTPRLIWALALNKHIYTTNSNIVKFSFYNKEFIHIINRENPIIDFNLITKTNINSRSSITYLRIDNWIKNFI